MFPVKKEDSKASRYSTGELFLVLLITLFAGLIRIPNLTQPLGPDQGIMSVIGEGILQGGLPYRDYWEMGSPAIFFTYALMFKIFGLSMAAIPIADTLVLMLTTFLVFVLCRSTWDKKVGYASALFFAFFSNGVRFGMHAGGDIAFGTFWYIAQRESFMLPLMVASFHLMLRSDKTGNTPSRLFFSGLLAGCAFSYKFPASIIIICLCLYLNATYLLGDARKPWKTIVVGNATFISGFVLAIIPFAIFFTVKGAMNEMISVIFKYVWSVYGQLEHDYLGTIKMGLARTLFLAKENFILWVFFVTSSIYILKNERTKEHVLIVLWALASLLFVVSHREFFGYHYLMILPPFSILAGYGMVKVLQPNLGLRSLLTEDFGKLFVILTLCANLAFFATLNYMHYTKFFYYLTGKISRESYYSFFDAYPKHDYSFPADYSVAKYIVKNTNPKDTIYALGGIESVIYFLSQRTSPSRFVFSWIIFSGTHGAVPQAEVYRRELLSDLESNTPKYIITVGPLNRFEDFPHIYDFVNRNYVLEKTFQDDRFVYVHTIQSDKTI